MEDVTVVVPTEEAAPNPDEAKPVEPKVLTPEDLERIAARNGIIQEWLNDLGVFALVQFKNEDSVVSRISFSATQPLRPTLIAVFEKLLREFKLTEEIDAQIEIAGRMADQERARQSEVGKKQSIRDQILLKK